MVEIVAPTSSDPRVDTVLHGELARGDALIGTIAPVLRHLLANDEHSVFSDEIIARMHGTMEHVAQQLLDILAEVSGQSEDSEYSHALLEALKHGFIAHPGFLAHTHALALEWQLTERLHVRLALDPVLSPLLQALIASTEPPVAANAMALLAAQARFVQAQRRMQLPLYELPGELLHAAAAGLASLAGGAQDAQQHAVEAERMIRSQYDESRTRLGLAARLVTAMGSGASAALSVTHAGVAIFVSALALASGQGRDMAVLATNEGQLARLALALRASGLKPEAIADQFVSLHPSAALPEGIEQIRPDRAAALLAHSAAYPGL